MTWSENAPDSNAHRPSIKLAKTTTPRIRPVDFTNLLKSTRLFNLNHQLEEV